MSARWLKRLVLAAALAVMPLQGVAAALSVLLCHGDAQVHTLHEGGDHGHGAQQAAHQHDDGNPSGGGNYHLCCHLSVTAPSTVTLPAALPNFPVRAFAPDALHDLFVPAQPQRPPLA